MPAITGKPSHGLRGLAAVTETFMNFALVLAHEPGDTRDGWKKIA